MTGRRRRTPKDAVRGKVRAHDPFELIRWLALSQPDPRKALAELVQNSLDAGARTIRIVRVRERGIPALRIWDDGDGVIPELGRAEALRFIATHIGHSRKRDLSPQERLQLMTQGQYGIGLLGFWSLGVQLEMRSAVPGQSPHRLVLHRDEPDYLVEPLRGRLPLGERWTEVVVSGLHPEAQSALLGRRAADFLAAELRGQLLAREVQLLVEDRMARGRAPKLLEVRPPKFLGEPIEGIARVEVPGHAPIRVEIYLASGESGNGEAPSPVAVYAAGTLVAARFEDLAALDLDHVPWTDTRLTGLVDFPDLSVAPGSRRGIIVDDAAGFFARALRGVEPILVAALEAVERRRAETLDRGLIRDLQRAFREFARHRPRWSMLPVAREADVASAGEEGGAASDAEGVESEPREPGAPVPARGTPSPPLRDLLPPGPMTSVRLEPRVIRIGTGVRRRLTATPLDAAGRPSEEEVRFVWRASGPIGSLEVDEAAAHVVLVAGAAPGEGSIEVTATSASGSIARDTAEVEVVDVADHSRGNEGIPQPVLVDAPGATWRSRVADDRWEVNSAHRDWRAAAERPTVKLRYLALLFSKELVLRNSQDPRLEAPLEQLVEAFTFADRTLSRVGKAAGRREV